jgi:hypothetical protein
MARGFKVLGRMSKVPDNLKIAGGITPGITPVSNDDLDAADACECDCQACRDGDCAHCSNAQCTDPHCEDCPMQASASAHLTEDVTNHLTEDITGLKRARLALSRRRRTA